LAIPTVIDRHLPSIGDDPNIRRDAQDSDDTQSSHISRHLLATNRAAKPANDPGDSCQSSTNLPSFSWSGDQNSCLRPLYVHG
jgi:hypothetical protein